MRYDRNGNNNKMWDNGKGGDSGDQLLGGGSLFSGKNVDPILPHF